MTLEWFVGLRYLLSSRKNTFLSVITVLSILGVATGVCFLIMVLAVLAGFEGDLRDKIIGFDSHIMIRGENGLTNYSQVEKKLSTIPGIKGAMPYIEGEVLVSSEQKNRGVILRGIDPKTAPLVLEIEKSLQGSCSTLAIHECFSISGNEPPILVGAELANNLRIFLDSSRRLKILSPLGHFGPLGFEPRIREFQVVGTFRSGFYDFDTQMVFVPLEEAKKFYSSPDRITGIDVKIYDLDQTKKMKAKIKERLSGFPGLILEDWQERNEKLFSAMKLEKLVMFIVLLFIVLVASFVILVTMSMLVLEKRRELAILRTIGLTKRKIVKIFVLDGALIGTIGAILGFIFGLTLCLLLARYQFIPIPSQYYMTTIPVELQWGDMGIIAISSIMLAIFATLYPAFQGGNTTPVEMLRYE